MRTILFGRTCRRLRVTVLLLLLWVQNGVAQYAEIRAEIETVQWSASGTVVVNASVRSVVGTNVWLIEGETAGLKSSWCFTGTNLVLDTVKVAYPSKYPELYERNHPEQVGTIGQHSRRVFQSDGSPFVNEVMGGHDFPVWSAREIKVSWLAFCSGVFLKRAGRQIPLTSLTYLNPAVCLDVTSTFDDGLGLPVCIDVVTTNRENVLQYRALTTSATSRYPNPKERMTDLLGWTFPTEFHLAQYRPTPSNGWELHLTSRGKIAAIGALDIFPFPAVIATSTAEVHKP